MIFRDFAARTRPFRGTFSFVVLALSAVLISGCALIHHPNSNAGLPVAPGEQPDKILLHKAENEFKHGRYDTGRLLLQAMINTYPDSEYLSQAKLAIANSYFRQGGISGLTEAEAEYKDFITFFPTAPEAPMAEYRAGMCHFRLMGKADRDQTEAGEAQQEFREFLLKFPDSPLMPVVKDRLREVQEVLAEGDYEIAMFYYRREDNRASALRFKEIANKYPNFSQGDQVFWYLGQTYERLRQPRQAIPYYDRIVMEFPLSPWSQDAKDQLASLHAPIPKPTRAVLARARADKVRDDRRSLLSQVFGGFSGAPDLSKTLHGPVVLGSPNQIQARIAKLNAPKPGARATLTAQNVNVTKTSSAGSTDPKAKGGGNAATSGKGRPSLAAQKGNSSTPEAVLPEKKDSKLHFLKKVIPF